MTLDQWKANKDLCKWAATTFSSQEGQLFLQMLEQIHVKNFQPADPRPEMELGKIYGYDVALNNIASASEYVKPPKGLGPAEFMGEHKD